jgi:hypothetical protein
MRDISLEHSIKRTLAVPLHFDQSDKEDVLLPDSTPFPFGKFHKKYIFSTTSGTMCLLDFIAPAPVQ